MDNIFSFNRNYHHFRINRSFPVHLYVSGYLICKLIYYYYSLNKITPLIWTFVKIIVCVWLYHPTYQGALFLEKTFSKYIDMVCDKTKPILDPLFAILGVNQSHEVEEETNKKQE